MMSAERLQRLSLESIPSAEDITRVELPNGIVVLARANPHSLSVTVRGYLEVGGLVVPDEKLGLADFVASALMRGTEQQDFQAIYDSLESIGASLGFNGGTHTTGLGGRSLAEDLNLLLKLLAETLLQPTFPLEQVERLRAELLTDLALRAQDTREMASMTFDELVYRQHPYGRADDGHPETIPAISQQDLVNFHKQYYGPKGMVLAIVGGVEPAEAVELVQAALGDWQHPEQPEMPTLPEWEPLPERVQRRVEIAGKSQSDVVIGTAGPARDAEDYMAAALGNNILGRFGMMGRVGEAVRERAGLAYYAYSSLSGGIGPGPWAVQAGVNPTNEEKASELIFAEIEKFVTQLVGEDELSDSQSNFIGSMPLSLESNGGVAQALLTIERHQLGLDYYRQYPDLVRAVTRSQVRKAAGRYLQPAKMATAIAGPPHEES